jgi:hypothetical protein
VVEAAGGKPTLSGRCAPWPESDGQEILFEAIKNADLEELK